MRINKEKFPILDWLKMSVKEMHRYNHIGAWVRDVNNTNAWNSEINGIRDDWNIIKSKIGSNIDYVSDEFQRNVLKSNDMMNKLDFESFAREYKPSGLLILNGGMQYYYDYSNYDKRRVLKFREDALEFSFEVNGDLAYFLIEDVGVDAYKRIEKKDLIAMYGEKKGKEVYDRVKDSGILAELEESLANSQEERTKSNQFFITSIVSYIETIILFKHYAKVETIHVKPKEKVRDPNSKEKHFNETDISINILDCRWFNNIIRDEPFGVRGHFRLQPKKDETGKWIKEMIYIKPFIKSGYNLKARKLN